MCRLAKGRNAQPLAAPPPHPPPPPQPTPTHPHIHIQHTAMAATPRQPLPLLLLLLTLLLATVTLSQAAATLAAEGSKPEVYVGRSYKLTVSLTEPALGKPAWGTSLKHKIKADNFTNHAVTVTWTSDHLAYKRSRVKPHLPLDARTPVVGTRTLNWAAVPVGQYEKKDYMAKLVIRFKAKSQGTVELNAAATPVGGSVMQAPTVSLDVVM